MIAIMRSAGFPVRLPQPLVALLPPDLHDRCVSHDCPAGTALFWTGDRPRWMFFVSEGEIVLERHAKDGRTVCLQRCRSGFVGEASLTSGRYHCDGRAARPSRMTKVPIRALREALTRDGEFAERWIRMLSWEVRRLRLQNERMALPRVKDRPLHLLETEGDEGRYRLTCSLKELARQLAVTHEALYRAIAHLVAQGRIDRRGDSLVSTLESPASRNTRIS